MKNTKVKFKDENKVLWIFFFLPISFENFKDSLLDGKEDTVILDEVKTTLRSKELSNLKYLKVDDSGEGLSISRGRSEDIGSQKGKSMSNSKSKFFY